MFGVNITGNRELDLFIVQSDTNKELVKRKCQYYYGGDLIKCIYALGLRVTDFTDTDWQELCCLYGVN